MPQKTNHIRTAFILLPGHLKQPYGFLVRCPVAILPTAYDTIFSVSIANNE